MNIGWTPYLLVCSLGLVIAIVIAGPKRVRNPLHFGAAFLGLMYITYVLRPYLSYTIGEGMTFLDLYLPGTSYLVERNTGELSIAFMLSVTFFAAGYRSLVRPFVGGFLPQETTTSNHNRTKVFRTFALALIVIGYTSFIFVRSGGLFGSGTVEYTRYAGGVVYSNSTGYIEYANYLVVSGVILFFAATGKLRLAILLSLPWTLNQIYLGWQRYMFFNLAIGLAVVAVLLGYRLKHGSKIRTTLVIALGLVALFLLITMRSDRFFLQSGRSFNDLASTSYSQSIDAVLGDFSGFEGTWYMVDKVDEMEPFYGASIVYRNAVLLVPRLLWPGKPLKAEFTWENLLLGGDASTKWRDGLVSVEDYVWYNTAVRGSIGYALEEWGWIGIPINFFVTGLFFAYVEKRFCYSSQSPAWLAAYGATYALITMQGRNDLFEFLMVYTLIFYLPYYYVSRYLASSSTYSRRISPVRNRVGLRKSD